jgi:hypothetical protein
MNRVAVVYHYFEKDQTYRDNFIFFLSCAWRIDLDFFIVISGQCSIDLPKRPNLSYLTTENYGHDFGSYGVLVASGALDLYERLVFVNCSVRGPFQPAYTTAPWTDAFLDLLKGDVHLCGATINILREDRDMSKLYAASFPEARPPFSHVQSFARAMTAEWFAFVREQRVFELSQSLDKFAAIVECEIGMSQSVLARGWNISCILPPYRGLDYRTLRSDMNLTTKTGHPLQPGTYFGRDLHPYEAMFLKTSLQAGGVDDLALHSLLALAPEETAFGHWREAEDLVQRLLARMMPQFQYPK